MNSLMYHKVLKNCTGFKSASSYKNKLWSVEVSCYFVKIKSLLLSGFNWQGRMLWAFLLYPQASQSASTPEQKMICGHMGYISKTVHLYKHYFWVNFLLLFFIINVE